MPQLRRTFVASAMCNLNRLRYVGPLLFSWLPLL